MIIWLCLKSDNILAPHLIASLSISSYFPSPPFLSFNITVLFIYSYICHLEALLISPSPSFLLHKTRCVNHILGALDGPVR